MTYASVYICCDINPDKVTGVENELAGQFTNDEVRAGIDQFYEC